MRKVTKITSKAFMQGNEIKLGSTKTVIKGSHIELYLHGNLIAQKNLKENVISITNAGWFSNTTKERLNGLPNVKIQQIKGKWFLNGKEWSGNLIELK